MLHLTNEASMASKPHANTTRLSTGDEFSGGVPVGYTSIPLPPSEGHQGRVPMHLRRRMSYEEVFANSHSRVQTLDLTLSTVIGGRG